MIKRETNNPHRMGFYTCFNRYPGLFNQVARIFKDNLKILSFGCSEGKELITLRKYFPKSLIIGAEINNEMIVKAKKITATDPNINVIKSNYNNIMNQSPFDLIFAIRVLAERPPLGKHKVGPFLPDCSEVYSFKRFNNQVNELHTFLKKEGGLIIHAALFRFVQTDIMEKYMYDSYMELCPVPMYDKYNKLIKERIKTPSIFIKKYD